MNRAIFLLIFTMSLNAMGQDIDSIRFPILHFNPYENFHFIELDRLESPQNQDDFGFNSYQSLVPFGMGIEKDIYHNSFYLLSASASINVHFIFRNENRPILNGIRKTYFNTDFLLRLHNTFMLSNSDKVRVTFYHRSTHLGDDYVILNDIRSANYWPEDESNYEAIQIQYAKEKRKALFYLGTQIVIRPDTPRERIEFHHGLTFKNFSSHKLISRLFIGYDLKFLKNNNYNLDTDIGIGYAFSSNSHIRINYFSGHIPFSRFERSIKNSWIGIGFYINASRI